MIQANELHSNPNRLARHYSRFRVSERLLLSGHSHQAWPDCAYEGQKRGLEDALSILGEEVATLARGR